MGGGEGKSRRPARAARRGAPDDSAKACVACPARPTHSAVCVWVRVCAWGGGMPHRAMASLYSMSQRSECSSRFFLDTRAASERRACTASRGCACGRWWLGARGGGGAGGWGARRGRTACAGGEGARACRMHARPTHQVHWRARSHKLTYSCSWPGWSRCTRKPGSSSGGSGMLTRSGMSQTPPPVAPQTGRVVGCGWVGGRGWGQG